MNTIAAYLIHNAGEAFALSLIAFAVFFLGHLIIASIKEFDDEDTNT